MAKKYLVAKEVGGLMEQPEIYYTNKQIIEANSPKEAENIYNEQNDCHFFYGVCLGEYDEATGKVAIDIDKL